MAFWVYGILYGKLGQANIFRNEESHPRPKVLSNRVVQAPWFQEHLQ